MERERRRRVLSKVENNKLYHCSIKFQDYRTLLTQVSIRQLYHGLRGSKSLNEGKKKGMNLERKFFHFGRVIFSSIPRRSKSQIKSGIWILIYIVIYLIVKVNHLVVASKKKNHKFMNQQVRKFKSNSFFAKRRFPF